MHILIKYVNIIDDGENDKLWRFAPRYIYIHVYVLLLIVWVSVFRVVEFYVKQQNASFVYDHGIEEIQNIWSHLSKYREYLQFKMKYTPTILHNISGKLSKTCFDQSDLSINQMCTRVRMVVY